MSASSFGGFGFRGSYPRVQNLHITYGSQTDGIGSFETFGIAPSTWYVITIEPQLNSKDPRVGQPLYWSQEAQDQRL